MHNPLKNRLYLSRDGTIWACANLRDGAKIIDFPLVSARHTERSRTHATHWSHHRSPSMNTDEFSRGPNQEVQFVLGIVHALCALAPRGHEQASDIMMKFLACAYAPRTQVGAAVIRIIRHGRGKTNVEVEFDLRHLQSVPRAASQAPRSRFEGAQKDAINWKQP